MSNELLVKEVPSEDLNVSSVNVSNKLFSGDMYMNVPFSDEKLPFS